MLWISQEIYDPRTSLNPAFELGYWGYALGRAQAWRERLGLGRSAEWDHVPAPGFPDDGSWTVRAEGLRPLP
jgi:hypothetical protein